MRKYVIPISQVNIKTNDRILEYFNQNKESKSLGVAYNICESFPSASCFVKNTILFLSRNLESLATSSFS